MSHLQTRVRFTSLFSRAEQAIAQGKVDYASQLLIQALQDIREHQGVKKAVEGCKGCKDSDLALKD